MTEQTNSAVGVKDDIGQEIEAKQREQIERELKSFEEQLESVTSLKERHLRQIKRDAEIFKIRLTGSRKINPTFEYEESDRFWELITDAVKDEAEADKAKGEGQQKAFEHQIEQLQDAIKNSKEDLAKMDSEE